MAIGQSPSIAHKYLYPAIECDLWTRPCGGPRNGCGERRGGGSILTQCLAVTRLSTAERRRADVEFGGVGKRGTFAAETEL